MPTLTFFPPNGGTSIEFSEDDDADYKLLLSYTGFANTPVSHKTVSAPGQHGVTLFNSVASPRTITIELMIQSDTIAEQKALVTALSTALNPLLGTGVLQYENDDGNTYVIYCVGNGGPDITGTDRTPTSQRATVTLIANDPFFYSGSPHYQTLGTAGVALVPFTIPWTLGGSTASQIIVNAGSHESPVTITINGPVTNPVITRTALEDGVTTTRTLSITKVLASGDTFVVTTGKGTQTATYTPTGGSAALGEPYVDIDSVYWVLMPGSNTVAFSCSADGTAADTVEITWSDKWAGV